MKAILDFRDNLRDAILRDAGEEAVTFLGGATGLYHGYLDFIAWDLPAVLTAAQAFFEESGLPYAHFHAFRRDVGGVPLLDEEETKPDIHEETGSLLAAEDIETLESFDEGTSGYFWRMLQWLEDFIKNGVEEGRFSEKQAHQDLQIALWYAFACNNIDDYIHYYQAVEWMKSSEKNAAGCATWYYRYSVALMYCGRLEEALEYAERGALEEPDYPWIWLHLGKLRAHFGDQAGALDAVKQGLKLEPEDYEFLTLEKRSKPEPLWNRWSTIGSTPMPTKRSSRDWTRMRMINSVPWPVSARTRLVLPNFMSCFARSGMAMRKIPPAVNSNTR